MNLDKLDRVHLDMVPEWLAAQAAIEKAEEKGEK